MNRRHFLSTVAAAFVLDPERLLWQPGAKTISIAAPVRQISNAQILRAVRPDIVQLALLSCPLWSMIKSRNLQYV